VSNLSSAARPGAPAAPPKPTVLVVEDEHSIGQLIRSYLNREGYRVVWVTSGEDALMELPRNPIGLVVLDLGLPGMDGFDVCRRIRSLSATPIVMLTARDEEPDRVVGLELGADDHMTKPFSLRELSARIKAVLRRTEGALESAEVVELGDVVLTQESREVTVAGEPVQLTAKEFKLLAFLGEHAGKVISRETLLDRVWGMSYAGGTRTVDVHVAQLRRKLDRPELIQTVRGAGYKAVRT
jgi:DNA-binding response OmpR family regulator